MKQYIDVETGEIVRGILRSEKQIIAASNYAYVGKLNYRKKNGRFSKVYDEMLEVINDVGGAFRTLMCLARYASNRENKCQDSNKKRINSRNVADELGVGIRNVQRDIVLLIKLNIVKRVDGYLYINPNYLHRTTTVKTEIFKMFREGEKERDNINRFNESGDEESRDKVTAGTD